MDEFDRQDDQPPYDLEARRCARSWEDFERVKGHNPKQRERWALMIKIRETLREYQETLIRQSKVAAFEIPSMQVLDAFDAEFDGQNPSLLGASKSIYKCDENNISSLAQLHSNERKDRVSGFLAKHMFRWLQTTASAHHARFDPRVSYLYIQRLDVAVELVYAILSLVLLLGAILSLYFVQSPMWRIAIIIFFTLAFAACAIFLADGRRLAVFGACAAYAAVLVVFVSGNWTPADPTLESG
ncbi:hypothetical protein J1614_010813 [Plenodomus biglobosus]|nr:hypothetical protein J1614_010813 [Plenodomus biglobosus]